MILSDTLLKLPEKQFSFFALFLPLFQPPSLPIFTLFSFFTGGWGSNGLRRWLSGKESACQCRRLMRCGFDWSLGWEDPLEEEMGLQSHILAWKMSWTEKPGGLSVGLRIMECKWAGCEQEDLIFLFPCLPCDPLLPLFIPRFITPMNWCLFNLWHTVIIRVCTDPVLFLGFPGGSDSKESACNARVLGSIPGLGRSAGEGNGYPLQCSCLDIGAWWATVHGVKKSQTWLFCYSSLYVSSLPSSPSPDS